MNLRPYTESDYKYISGWLSERHSFELWSAGRLSFPLNEGEFGALLKRSGDERGECAYVFSEESGVPVGFCCFAVNAGDNSGFVRFIMVDGSSRGQGIGTRMMTRLLEHAFETARVDTVRLCVFDANPAAKRCYEKVGFAVESMEENAYRYNDECWCRMTMAAHRKSEI